MSSPLLPEFRILEFGTLDSTNNFLLREAAQGAPEGLVAVAEYQTGGRGRYQREWVSPRGKNLLFSLLLRPRWRAEAAPLFTWTLGQVIARVLETGYGVKPELKRPNDILVGKKKICGILVETSTEGKRLGAVVAGVGLNVNAAGKELYPGSTSLCEVTGRRINRSRLLSRLLEAIRNELPKLPAMP